MPVRTMGGVKRYVTRAAAFAWGTDVKRKVIGKISDRNLLQPGVTGGDPCFFPVYFNLNIKLEHR